MAQSNNQAGGNGKTLNPQPPFNAEIESVCDLFRGKCAIGDGKIAAP